jgi:hypothetical protein
MSTSLATSFNVVAQRLPKPIRSGATIAGPAASQTGSMWRYR